MSSSTSADRSAPLRSQRGELRRAQPSPATPTTATVLPSGPAETWTLRTFRTPRPSSAAASSARSLSSSTVPSKRRTSARVPAGRGISKRPTASSGVSHSVRDRAGSAPRRLPSRCERERRPARSPRRPRPPRPSAASGSAPGRGSRADSQLNVGLVAGRRDRLARARWDRARAGASVASGADVPSGPGEAARSAEPDEPAAAQEAVAGHDDGAGHEQDRDDRRRARPWPRCPSCARPGSRGDRV